MKYDSVLTTCPFCGCGCQFYLQVMDGQLVGLIPCKTDEISQGKLCIKGRNAYQFVQNEERLTTPLIKRNGKLEPATWQEALDVVSQKLSQIKDKSGPDSLAFLSSAKCTNEENYLFMKFARTVMGTNNVDHCARLCHSSTLVGLLSSFGSGAMTNSIPEIEGAECIFVIGSNTIEQHPLIGSRILKAKGKGATLVVVDPRHTPLSAFADVFLQIRPGTDVCFLNGLMNELLAKGMVDREFISQRTEGFEDFKKKIEEYTPARVQEVCGVAAADLEKAARLYGEAKKASLIYCMGITQHTTGTDNVRSCANLAMLTGNIGRESTGVNPLRGQNNVQGSCDMGALPTFYSGYQSVADKAVKEKFEKAWNSRLSDSPGLTMGEMFEAAHKGQIKAMYIMGENPMLSEPSLHHTEEAIRKLEFLVVQDIFLTETARLADVVLPAASFAEKEGTFAATDRRVLRVRKAIDPVGGSQPDWVIISNLAQKMGNNQFNYSSPERIMEEIARLTPSYGGISYGRLDKGEILAWPCPNASHAGTRFLHKGTFTRGKGRFYAIDYKEPAEMPEADFPFVLTTGRVMFQYHTGTMTRKIPSLNHESAAAFVEVNPGDAKKLGVKNGERVTVKSKRGEIQLDTAVTDGIAPGVVFIPFHFAESAANVLTSRQLDPESKIPELKVCAVSIQKEAKQ